MKCTCSFSYFSAPRPSSHLSSVAMVESSAGLPVAPGHMPPSTRSLGFEEERQGAGDAGEAAVLTRGRRWCPAGGEGATAAGRRYGHRGREERRGRGWLGRGVGESWRKGRESRVRRSAWSGRFGGTPRLSIIREYAVPWNGWVPVPSAI